MKSEGLLKGTLFASTGHRWRDLCEDQRRQLKTPPWSTQVVRSANTVNPALKRMRGIIIQSK